MIEGVPERVIFASESFGYSMLEHIKFIKSLKLTAELEQKIMSDNAAGIYKEDFTMPEQIDDKKLKQQIARLILEALHEWFEVEESREKYISECANWIFFAAKEAINTPDFCALKKQEKKQ